jgi:hypothetical protein
MEGRLLGGLFVFTGPSYPVRSEPDVLWSSHKQPFANAMRFVEAG